ncbi:alpha-N-acetylglucosaminidase [Pedobacter sp. AK013]|uniref:alpha-N-acetylglucosaminidase n=1 Tax=Pedobacter sp. AK013 TaxID=2723071 RepID=UPI00161CD071|nr:alpha-N-acetylglucosaminidase [Pedobacter sp. AK013]MBB6236436.1 alpha-N-acetylglucosaminidase [Pedobacter sp. AK013]
MRILKFVFLLTVLFLNTHIKAQTFDAVRQLAARRAPWLTKSLVFKSIPANNGKDVFELYSRNNKIEISASGANAAAEGLNWYLKYYCRRSMSHMGDNLSPIEKIPLVKEKIRIVSPYPYRYALNYCTISYSMSFYNWADWERELDWMALNGVNVMLAPIGMEAVWQNTLKKLGYSEQETLEFIPGPAFDAWWLMGNMESWGGPVTQNLINQQAYLEKKIIARMKDLGIEPVMHGFYGMVPTTLKNKVKVDVISQGKWVGGFIRPDFLSTGDPAFKRIADIYYNEMKKLYGADLHYFGGDPFHEGGSAEGVDLKASGAVIQQLMQQHYPNATWVLQGWQSNPSAKLLEGLDKKKTLIIELFGENTNNWEKRKSYGGTPFIWSNVSNFGEKNGIYGKLQRFADETYRAKKGVYGQFLKGVGIIPEGINNNPVTFDLMLELGWHDQHVEVNNWIKGYTLARYGKANDKIEKAWQGLLETAYSSPEIYQEGPSESIFCARPDTLINSVSSWGTRKRNYNTAKFRDAVLLFASAAADFKESETYQTDLTDFVRQVQANKGDVVYKAIIEAIKNKDKDRLAGEGSKFIALINQQDSLLNSNRFFTLHRWLKQASVFGTNHADKTNALKNAKAQITYWGPDDNPKTDLHEYAHKEWAGLLGSLCTDRWKLFMAYHLRKLNGEETTKPNYYKLETDWANSPDLFAPKKISDKQRDELIEHILKGSED